MTCPTVTVAIEAGTAPIVTTEAGTAPVVTGDVFGVGLSSGPTSCCQEGVIQSGVIYNGQWSHDDAINFDATIG